MYSAAACWRHKWGHFVDCRQSIAPKVNYLVRLFVAHLRTTGRSEGIWTSKRYDRTREIAGFLYVNVRGLPVASGHLRGHVALCVAAKIKHLERDAAKVIEALIQQVGLPVGDDTIRKIQDELPEIDLAETRSRPCRFRNRPTPPIAQHHLRQDQSQISALRRRFSQADPCGSRVACARSGRLAETLDWRQSTVTGLSVAGKSRTSPSAEPALTRRRAAAAPTSGPALPAKSTACDVANRKKPAGGMADYVPLNATGGNLVGHLPMLRDDDLSAHQRSALAPCSKSPENSTSISTRPDRKLRYSPISTAPPNTTPSL